jgi:hypothetical protein
MDDIERNGWVFSDGVGTIPVPAMRKIWKVVPSVRDLKLTASRFDIKVCTEFCSKR